MSDLINVIQMELILHSIDFHTKSLEKTNKTSCNLSNPFIPQSFLRIQHLLIHLISILWSIICVPFIVCLCIRCIASTWCYPSVNVYQCAISMLSVCSSILLQNIPAYYFSCVQHWSQNFVIRLVPSRILKRG